ncbi:hypothetical protein ACIRF8_21130 [Streptomyces sp. NPDC102406]|uniref:8-oxoguanine DNA glycosylase OGG fold protein n=1 Tax=Streptomyces sp. NPDC102406 TaxID=3366171 RepID=UPI0037FB270C
MPAGVSVPDRVDVLGQAIPFDRSRWTPLLPDSGWWPPELDNCPMVSARPRVDRNTVFAVARRSDTVEGRRHLLTAALVWGTGTKAQSVARRARIFQESTPQDIDARLETVLGVLREKGAVEAYYAFNNDHRIKFLGPAFFTKLLYFAGHVQPTGQWRPLILDSIVAKTIRAINPDEKWRGSGWTTPDYARYLTIVHDQARQAGVLPDQVEAALFVYGKQLG